MSAPEPQTTIDLAAWVARNGALAHGSLPPRLDPAHLSTDSRDLRPESVFLPLVGEKFDGHRFLEQAFAQGCELAFCGRDYFAAHEQELQPLSLILVDDTLAAYQSLARHWRRQLGLPVIAISGSSGKTSTKEILARVLGPFFFVHRSEANFNNEIGVPRTLLDLRPEHQVCIVEMGMRGLGQIAELCAIAEPDYGILTNIGPVHLSELGSIENIARAKWELADWLQEHEGLLVINGENEWLSRLGKDYQGTLRSAGRSGSDDPQLLTAEPTADGGQQIRYRLQGSERTLWLDLAGEHQAQNLLCCLAVLAALGHRLPDGARLEVPRLFGRQQRLELGGMVLINDAYNANPDSMKAALNVLAAAPPRRIAVLGKMAELGPQAEQFHHQLGEFCDGLALDAVYVVGAEAEAICQGLKTVPCQYFASKSDLIKVLQEALRPGDTVLFKASRSACLEEVVEPVTQYFTRLD